MGIDNWANVLTLLKSVQPKGIRVYHSGCCVQNGAIHDRNEGTFLSRGYNQDNAKFFDSTQTQYPWQSKIMDGLDPKGEH